MTQRDGPAIVLLNPRAAGGRARDCAGPAGHWLAEHAPGVGLHVADGVAGARATIAGQPADARIVLVGGDGTVNRMLPALLERGCAFALVPAGSGNDTARALGVAGLPWPQALAHALSAPAVPMDIGEFCDGSRRVHFASSLTAGFDAAVSLRALLGPRWLEGLPRYLLATLREIAALRTWQMSVRCDGALVHDGAALFASALNTPTFGSGMPAVPHARIDDGALDVLIAGEFSRLGTAMMMPRLLAGRHLADPRVATRPFATLAVEAGAEVPIAGDGEPAGTARSWTVATLPAALRAVRRTPGAVTMPPS
jgi:diacylglycerol kinase family enzyme